MKKLLISTVIFMALVQGASTQETTPQEKAAQEKITQEKAEQEKIAQEKAEQEKKAALEKAAKEKAVQEKIAKEKAAKEKVEQEKIAREKAEQERIAQEKAAKEKAIQDRIAREKVILNIFESSAEAKPVNQIDNIVFAKLKSLNIKPAICSDNVFVRRAYLDVIGTLPTAEEAKAFIHNPDIENKRRILIDQLLARTEFADYWAMKWGDILRIKAEYPVNLWPNAAQAYHRWVKASIVENKPYDKFVREMLTSSGSNFRVAPVNFYRAIQSKTPEGIASAVALAFMGSRTDSWPEGRYTGMLPFFSQVGYKPTSEWKEELVFWDPVKSSVLATSIAPGNAKPTTVLQETAAKSVEKPKETPQEEPTTGIKIKVKVVNKTPKDPPAPPPKGIPLNAIFPDGTSIHLSPDKDPREVFADWLITPKNPWFARCAVNRIWAWLLGRGIIHEPDDIRDNNPPSNPELLAYLEKEFIASHYDMKTLYRLILTSTTYQFSAIPHSKDPQAEINFASYPTRRLDAEVLIDAINKITGSSDLYTSPIPEPFTYIPKDMPAIGIADGSITSPFLALFGRSARATGMVTERNNSHISSQWLHTLNSGHIQNKLEQGPALKKMFSAGLKDRELLDKLYLTILSRQPIDEEVKILEKYAKPGPVQDPKKMKDAQKKAAWQKKRNDWLDIVWSLMNSTEFLYRH